MHHISSLSRNARISSPRLKKKRKKKSACLFRFPRLRLRGRFGYPPQSTLSDCPGPNPNKADNPRIGFQAGTGLDGITSLALIWLKAAEGDLVFHAPVNIIPKLRPGGDVLHALNWCVLAPYRFFCERGWWVDANNSKDTKNPFTFEMG